MHNRFSSDNLKFAFLSQLITFVVILQQSRVCNLVKSFDFVAIAAFCDYNKDASDDVDPINAT